MFWMKVSILLLIIFIYIYVFNLMSASSLINLHYIKSSSRFFGWNRNGRATTKRRHLLRWKCPTTSNRRLLPYSYFVSTISKAFKIVSSFTKHKSKWTILPNDRSQIALTSTFQLNISQNHIREGVQKKTFFLGLCPKHRTPPTHPHVWDSGPPPAHRQP